MEEGSGLTIGGPGRCPLQPSSLCPSGFSQTGAGSELEPFPQSRRRETLILKYLDQSVQHGPSVEGGEEGRRWG